VCSVLYTSGVIHISRLRDFAGFARRRGSRHGFAIVLLVIGLRVPAQAQDLARSPAELRAQGIALMRQGSFAEAQVPLQQAVRLNPHDLEAVTLLGKVDGLIGEKQASVALLTEVVKQVPRLAEAHFNLSIALASLPDFSHALEEADASIKLDPRSASMHRNRGKVLSDLRRTPEAVREYETALALYPADTKALYDLALLRKEAGGLIEQTQLLQRLSLLQPGNAQVHYLIGQSLGRQGKEAEAALEWREALRLNPKHREALYSLARSLRASSPQEAEELMRRFQALREKDDSLDAIRKLGNDANTAMQQQQWVTAIDLLHKALQQCEDCSLQAHLTKNLGLAECQSGSLDAGEHDLKTALSLDPADPDIVLALHVVERQRADSSLSH